MLRLVITSAILFGFGVHSAHALDVRVKKVQPKQTKRARTDKARQLIRHAKLANLKRRKAISGETVLQNLAHAPVEVLGMKGMIGAVEQEIIDLAAKASHVELRQKSSTTLELHTFIEGTRTAIISAQPYQATIQSADGLDTKAQVKLTDKSLPQLKQERIVVDFGDFTRREDLEFPKAKPPRVTYGLFKDSKLKVLSRHINYEYEDYLVTDTGQTTKQH